MLVSIEAAQGAPDLLVHQTTKRSAPGPPSEQRCRRYALLVEDKNMNTHLNIFMLQMCERPSREDRVEANDSKR